jgi:hypothetical protein
MPGSASSAEVSIPQGFAGEESSDSGMTALTTRFKYIRNLTANRPPSIGRGSVSESGLGYSGLGRDPEGCVQDSLLTASQMAMPRMVRTAIKANIPKPRRDSSLASPFPTS